MALQVLAPFFSAVKLALSGSPSSDTCRYPFPFITTCCVMQVVLVVAEKASRDAPRSLLSDLVVMEPSKSHCVQWSTFAKYMSTGHVHQCSCLKTPQQCHCSTCWERQLFGCNFEMPLGCFLCAHVCRPSSRLAVPSPRVTSDNETTSAGICVASTRAAAGSSGKPYVPIWDRLPSTPAEEKRPQATTQRVLQPVAIKTFSPTLGSLGQNINQGMHVHLP